MNLAPPTSLLACSWMALCAVPHLTAAEPLESQVQATQQELSRLLETTGELLGPDAPEKSLSDPAVARQQGIARIIQSEAQALQTALEETRELESAPAAWLKIISQRMQQERYVDVFELGELFIEAYPENENVADVAAVLYQLSLRLPAELRTPERLQRLFAYRWEKGLLQPKEIRRVIETRNEDSVEAFIPAAPLAKSGTFWTYALPHPDGQSARYLHLHWDNGKVEDAQVSSERDPAKA